MKRMVWLLLFFLLGIVTSGCGKAGQQGTLQNENTIRLVMTTTSTETGLSTLVAYRLADLVKKESGGRVLIEVYPKDWLAGGNTTKGVSMLANGSTDLAAYTSGNLSQLDFRLAVGTIPWAFADFAAARRVIDGAGGAYYEKLLAQHGIVYLASTHNGMRQIANNIRPVRKPEDLAGLRIRITGNPGVLSFLQSLGATPMPMSWSEVPDALRQGVVDGYDTDAMQACSAGLEKLTRYMTVCNYSYENYIVMANSKTFSRLTPETQALIRSKAVEACAWGRDLVEKNEAASRRKFAENGAVVTELSSEELAAFQRQAAPFLEKMKAEYGDEACRAFGLSPAPSGKER
ncbi:MAG: TRAP transporter substrate-binding protein DctP [Schwartzia sp.]|nr:TRAP transporter substrate-binding protein DctP [Schwartzia sp. (in: firmicutes)]